MLLAAQMNYSTEDFFTEKEDHLSNSVNLMQRRLHKVLYCLLEK
jgi:hypothetical protein